MSSLKTNHLINNIENAVSESLLGLVKTNLEIQLIKEYNVVIRSDLSDFDAKNGKRKVALISGGGSGHEPFASGFVGEHGVDAAVSGEIFSSPSSLSVLGAIQQFPKHVGILLILNNYTGDRLNFGIAIERARLLGYNVDILLAADDCSFHENKAKDLSDLQIDESIISKDKLGTRGLAGVYFIIRLANVLAKQGLNLKELRDKVSDYADLITTYSVSLNSCDIPGVGRSFNMDGLQYELGLGIHGELGANGRSGLEPLHSIIERMRNQLNKALADKLGKRLNKLPSDKIEFVVLVNNLGGLSQFEMNIVNNEIIEQINVQNILIKPDHSTKELLLDRSCNIVRLFSGTFLTSFAMHGCSVSLLPIIDNELIQLIDKIESNPIKKSNGLLNKQPLVEPKHVENQQTKLLIDDLSSIQTLFSKALTAACRALLHAKDELNHLDSELGDSDCGSTMASLAQNLLKEYIHIEKDSNCSFYRLFSCTASQMAGGTSGVIYSLLFTGIAEKIAELQHEFKNQHNKELPLDVFENWGKILEHGVKVVQKYSLAELEDKTLLDVLQPVADYLKKIDSSKLSLDDKYEEIDKLKQLVIELTQRTAFLVPKCGRASYAANRGYNCVDPGAKAVEHWLNAVLDTIKQFKQN